MTHTEAIAKLASHPHIRRLRELCDTDPAVDPETRDAYRRMVVAWASGDDPAAAALPPPIDPARRADLRQQALALRRARERAESCPYREACGCWAARCYHHKRLVTPADCALCLDSGGQLPPRS